jgi:spore germination protein YaaH
MAGALGPGRVDAHISSVLSAWRASGCGHLDLDYETLSLAQIRALEEAVGSIADGLAGNARLSLTLQPADGVLRPDQLPVYRRLLANPRVACLRLMAYDYHWRNSLPGALCPLPAFKRLIEAYPEYRSKLVMALPLYGYDWPRPDDATLPPAQSVSLRELEKLKGARATWMLGDAELALEYNNGARHMVAAPSLRAVRARVQAMLDLGVPNVCFWHLGCARHAPVIQACRKPGEDQPEHFSAATTGSWQAWQSALKQRACAKLIAQPGDTLESIARAKGIERSLIYRLNEDLTNDGLAGRTVYLPR